MGVFSNERRPLLRAKPLQQIWRDHLLMGSLLLARDFDEGAFAFLYPRDNFRCTAALDDYATCLLDASTFCRWTLEDFVTAIRAADPRPWADAFHRRYLDFSRVDALVGPAGP